MLFVEQVYCSGKVCVPFKLVLGGIAPLFLPPHPICSPHHLLPTWPVKGLVSFPPIEKICCREHLSGWETAKWHHMWQNLSLHFCTVEGGSHFFQASCLELSFPPRRAVFRREKQANPSAVNRLSACIDCIARRLGFLASIENHECAAAETVPNGSANCTHCHQQKPVYLSSCLRRYHQEPRGCSLG